MVTIGSTVLPPDYEKSPSVVSEVSSVPSALREQVAVELSSMLLDDVEPQADFWQVPPVMPQTKAPLRSTRPVGQRPPAANRVLVKSSTKGWNSGKDEQELGIRKAIVEEPIVIRGFKKEESDCGKDSSTAELMSYASGERPKDTPEVSRDLAKDLAKEHASQIFDGSEVVIPTRSAAIQPKDGDPPAMYNKKLSDSCVSTELGASNPAHVNNTLSASSSAKTLQSCAESGIMPNGVRNFNPLSNSSSAKTLHTWSEVAPGPENGDVRLNFTIAEVDSALCSKPSTSGSVRTTTTESIARDHAFGMVSGFGHSRANYAEYDSKPSTQGSVRPSTTEEVAKLHADQLAHAGFYSNGLRDYPLTPYAGLSGRRSPDAESLTILSVGQSEDAPLARNEATKMVKLVMQEAPQLSETKNVEAKPVTSGEAKYTSGHSKPGTADEAQASGRESVMSLGASTLDELAAVHTAQLLAVAADEEQASSANQKQWAPQRKQEQVAPVSTAIAAKSTPQLPPQGSRRLDSMSGVSVYSAEEPSDATYGKAADDLVREVMMHNTSNTEPSDSWQLQGHVASALAPPVAPAGAKVDSTGRGSTSVLSVTTGSEAEKMFTVAGVVGSIMGTGALSTIDSECDVLDTPSSVHESAAQGVAAQMCRLQDSQQDVHSAISWTADSVLESVAREVVAKESQMVASQISAKAGNSCEHGSVGLSARAAVSPGLETSMSLESHASIDVQERVAEAAAAAIVEDSCRPVGVQELGSGDAATRSSASRSMVGSSSESGVANGVTNAVLKSCVDETCASGSSLQRSHADDVAHALPGRCLVETVVSGSSLQRSVADGVAHAVLGGCVIETASEAETVENRSSADLQMRVGMSSKAKQEMREELCKTAKSHLCEASLDGRLQKIFDELRPPQNSASKSQASMIDASKGPPQKTGVPKGTAPLLHKNDLEGLGGQDKDTLQSEVLMTDSSVLTRSVDGSSLSLSLANGVADHVMQRCLEAGCSASATDIDEEGYTNTAVGRAIEEEKLLSDSSSSANTRCVDGSSLSSMNQFFGDSMTRDLLQNCAQAESESDPSDPCPNRGRPASSSEMRSAIGTRSSGAEGIANEHMAEDIIQCVLAADAVFVSDEGQDMKALAADESKEENSEDDIEDFRLQMRELFVGAAYSGQLEVAMQEAKSSPLENARLQLASAMIDAEKSGELQRALEISQQERLKHDRLSLQRALTRACENGDLERQMSDIAGTKQSAQTTGNQTRELDTLLPSHVEQASKSERIQTGLKDLLAAAALSGALESAFKEVDAEENDASESNAMHPEACDSGALRRDLASVTCEDNHVALRDLLITASVSGALKQALEEVDPQDAASEPAVRQSEREEAGLGNSQSRKISEEEVRRAENNRRLRALFFSCDVEEGADGENWASKRELINICRNRPDIREFLHLLEGAEEASVKSLGFRDRFSFAQLKAFYQARTNESLDAASASSRFVSQSSARDAPAEPSEEISLKEESRRSLGKPRKSIDLAALHLTYGRDALRLTPHVFVSREAKLNGLDREEDVTKMYVVHPELPAGLEIDSASGRLHGIPIVNTEMKDYEISVEIATADGRDCRLETRIALGVGLLAAPFHPPPGSTSPSPRSQDSRRNSRSLSNDALGSPARPPSVALSHKTSPTQSSRSRKNSLSQWLEESAKQAGDDKSIPPLANEMYEYAIECTATSDLKGLKVLINAGVLHPGHIDSKRIVDTKGRTLLEIARSQGDAKVLSLFFGTLINNLGKAPQPITETALPAKEQTRRSLYLSARLETNSSGSFFFPTVPEVIPYDSPCSHLPKLSAGLQIKEFSVWPQLPVGLELDPDTGELRGCPDEEVEEEAYTVTALLEGDIGEKVTCVIQFSVEEIQPPYGLSYPSVQRIVDSIRADEMGPATGNPMLPKLKEPTLQRMKTKASATEELAPIQPATPSTPRTGQKRLFRRPPSHFRVFPELEIGAATHFEVDPPLPLGMTLDAQTGEIRGAPALNERKACATNHTIVAENAEGMALCGICIEVCTGAWDLTVLHMRTTWSKNQSDIEEKMRTTTVQKGRRATQMRKHLEPIAKPRDVGRVDWKRQLDRSVSILEQFAHLVPIQIFDGKSTGSMIVKGMGASSLLKCLGVKEDPHTLRSLIDAVEFEQGNNPEGALLGTAEGTKNHENVIYLLSSGENADRRACAEKKVNNLATEKAAMLQDQAFSMDFNAHRMKRVSLSALGSDSATWTTDQLNREFKNLMPHWHDRVFTGELAPKLKRFKAWRQVCAELSAPELESTEVD